MAKIQSVNAYFASEKALPKTVHGTWNGCRVASIFNCVMDATWNEGNEWGSGRPRGTGGRTALMLKGIDAAHGNWKVDTGFNQGDVDEIQKGMFPHLPLPIYAATDDFQNLIRHLPQEDSNGDYPWVGKHVISISLRLSALAVSDAGRKYTSADHQLKLSKRRKRGGIWWVKMTDPMRLSSETYTGHWVKQSSIRKAAEAILGGIIVAELYPIGMWTAMRLKAASKNADIRALNADIDELETEAKADRQTIRSLEGSVEDQELQIAALELRLENCSDNEDVDLLVGAIDVAVTTLEQAKLEVQE